MHWDWFATAPFVSTPGRRHWSLPLLYLIFAIDVVLLYFPCSWFAKLKAHRREGWLKYL